MSFCPTCGEIIQPNALFCYYCNSNLTPKNNVNIYNNNPRDQSNTYNLGINLESFVEDTVLRIGYTNTEKRKRIEGISGTLHEIDILAYKGEIIVALECKNYTIQVGIKEIRDFKSKLDLPHISEWIFVTNSRFTPEAINYANHYNIRLWGGENLSKIHYLSSIGRLTNNSSKQKSENEKEENEITIDNILPVLLQYDALKKIKLVNPQQASIVKSELVFFPFYVINFSIKEQKKKWLGRTENISDNEIFIVNAIDGKILTDRIPQGDIKPFLFSKSNKKELDDKFTIDEQIRNHEENLIIETIKNTVPRKNYKIKRNSQFNIIIQKSSYPIEAAERRIVEEIVDRRKIGYDDVSVSGQSEVYVPKWSLIIETIGLTYKRESIASNNFIFRDEIDLCPKDSSKDVRKTYAICEMCGAAICSKHISNDNSMFFCSDHKVSGILPYRKTSKFDVNALAELNEIKDNVQSLLSTKILRRKKNVNNSDNNNIQALGLKEEKTEEMENTITQNSQLQDKDDDKTTNLGSPIKW